MSPAPALSAPRRAHARLDDQTAVAGAESVSRTHRRATETRSGREVSKIAFVFTRRAPHALEIHHPMAVVDEVLRSHDRGRPICLRRIADRLEHDVVLR